MYSLTAQKAGLLKFLCKAQNDIPILPNDSACAVFALTDDFGCQMLIAQTGEPTFVPFSG